MKIEDFFGEERNRKLRNPTMGEGLQVWFADRKCKLCGDIVIGKTIDSFMSNIDTDLLYQRIGEHIELHHKDVFRLLL